MLDTPLNGDADLLKRIWSGDEEAFLALYRRYQGMIYRFAMQMSGKVELAEEVTQEVFLLLVRGRDRYDPARGPLAAYLYGVARNHLLRALEKERPYASSLDDPDSPLADLAAPEADVLTGLTQAERMEALRRALLGLPAPYREVVVLCDLHELDYEEAARVLGCPLGTIRSRLHRARALLAWKVKAGERCMA